MNKQINSTEFRFYLRIKLLKALSVMAERAFLIFNSVMIENSSSSYRYI